MRLFIITTILTLICSVNTASIERRAVTAATMTCIGSIEAVKSQLAVVTNSVNSFSASQGFAGALAIHNQEIDLESKLSFAGGSQVCCFSVTVTEEDAQALLSVVDVFIPEFEAALTAIINKKPAFDTILLVTAIIKNDIKSLVARTSTLTVCFVSVIPASLQAEVNDYKSRIDAASDAAFAAYGI